MSIESDILDSTSGSEPSPLLLAIDTIRSLYEKYENDPYMSTKTHQYIVNQLPVLLENIKQTHEQRITRIEELTMDHAEFVQTFLNVNPYFYAASTDKFFHYDSLHYQLINEDDILYQVLSNISRDRTLMSWKYKTKVHIMKRIRDTPIIKSLPSSETIQHVIGLLYPALFSTKAEAKYFLTIIGDNILKKNTDLIHIIHPKSKHFIRELNHFCQFHIGMNLNQSFRHKFHDHDYIQCRLVQISDNVLTENTWIPIVVNSAIDIICVASHYSTRYIGSDEYISQYTNDMASVFYLKDKSPIEIVSQFVAQYLEFDTRPVADIRRLRAGSLTEDTETIIRMVTWKNMQYLWKHFLDSLQLPSIIFQQHLKRLLTEQLIEYYKEDTDTFVGVSSRFMPLIQRFYTVLE